MNLKQLKALCGAAVLVSATGLSTPAYAANEAMLDLLKILKDKGSLTQEEYELLVNASRADGEKVEGIKQEVKAEVKDAAKDLPKIKTKGKLEISKGDYKFRVGGRLQGDTTFALGDANLESEGGDPVTEFRRARMYVSGVLAKYWKFKLQYDFADDQGGGTPNTNGLKDAYLAYTGFKPVTITFGHHKTPLSIEELTSSKYITFIERSQLVNGIVTDLGGGRQYALSAHSYFNDMFTLSGSIYAGSSNEDTAETMTGINGRLTFAPIHEKTKVVHLGVGFDHTSSINETFNIDGEPEIHPGRDILETEGGDWEKANMFVAEASAVYGPWALQAEYASAELDEGATTPDADVDAWYIYGSYYLTGESRNYNWKKGSFKQTKVKNPLFKGGWGAWELALRYTSGEFDNTDGVTATSTSDADIMTAGINWYPNNNVRFSANYVSVLNASDDADAELAGDLDAGASADDADYMILRGQWYF
ncbi:MAG: OprO/OprP family phosphate-selective porin [Thiotrichales bacterium]|nr:OprO/OprP family phosphate-selective porin [Thiotrichales bacterium]